ncbi:glycosyltransferase family 4 protein [Sphingomonas sp. LaA6.9]|uniref:glycosyltransferase family 4 protein n=1 Tax=Sphingomonas sp. LaA6.9 TaxID=2919914 RepID=UPI001F500999|nr:glycosyltransferase family 4 protein [Sphingomonas sp. LaA6.9]MCJ8156703.1 glycosyltransferase [Sphingomonas sp. LaA6.9]
MDETTSREAFSIEAPAHIALIGNALPRRCGIATFTSDTYDALRARFPAMRVDLYAMDDGTGIIYPEHVSTIDQHDAAAYRAAARTIADSGARAVWLQHEYGIFGGSAGEFILSLLDRVNLPVLVTLHTVLEKPGADERRVLEALARRASRLIVMAETGREILRRVYGVSDAQIEVIPHGVPDRALVAPETLKPRFGFEGRDVILTFGLLAPDKGIEVAIEAMPRIVAAHPQALYVVLGATHPNLARREGEAYRERLIALAETLGVSAHLRFIDAFVGTDELLDYLQAADVYVTPYLKRDQITSGTLSYAVGVGKPVVSTPYIHATEILDQRHGVLVDFSDSAQMGDAISALLADDAGRTALAARAYARGRTMTWARVAEQAAVILGEMERRSPRRLGKASAGATALAPDLSAVLRMSDSTGMYQHGIYSVPDRHHGYCVDDNARALILLSRMEDVEESLRDQWMTVYAAFVQHSWNPDHGRFRNFMRFDRSWCEDFGSEDSHGRALWSLGVTSRHAPIQKHADWAANLFDRTAYHALALEAPRAQAFAMLGAAAVIEARHGHGAAREILESFGDQLLSLLAESRRPDWPWFETVLAYDNARLPEALLRAGVALGREDYRACGLQTLEWIVAQQIAPEGHFRAVGTDSFGREFQPPMPFDQQPLEAQATIDACEAAFAASGDVRWVDEAQRAYRWFLGENDLDMPLATRADGGCFDGLMPTGLNRNQGAESILALQLASCAISRLSKAATAVPKRLDAVA